MIKKFIYTTCFMFFFTSSSFGEFQTKARTVILQDFFSGEILYEKDADISIYPASMTKIMTAIIAFDFIKSGDINLDDKFIVSEKAWRLSTSGYSSMFIMVNDEVSVEDLLRGIIVASGNDACVTLAEGIAGTEEEFAILMTSKAKELGMENTNFANSSGINDPDNYSTARDILIMSNYLIKNHPNFYEYFAELEFTWDRTGGDPITQGNRNPLLYKNIGADGIKTGYLDVEKYSLASSINRNGRRLIAVGSGFETKNSRSKQSQKLLKINSIILNDKFPDLKVNIERLKVGNEDLMIDGKKIAFGVDSFEDYKMWFEEDFIKLAELLHEKGLFDYIYLVCGPDKSNVAKKIINDSGKKYFIDCSNKDLIGVILAIKNSTFYIGNNSGPLNLSAALGVKTFGLIANDPVSELKYSKITPITPQDYKDDIWTRNREGMKKLKPDEVLNKIINNL